MSSQYMRKLMETIENLEDSLGRVDVNLTADQWGLFTHSMDCTEAADALNRAVEDNVNLGFDREEVEEEVYKVMNTYSDYGANDTEPRTVLTNIIDELYAEEF